MLLLRCCVLALGLALPFAASAQGTAINLGGLRADPDAPVEITADSLSVDQDSRRAVFAGAVAIIQGDLRITAGQVEVVYSEETGDIARLILTGGVGFVTATETAQAEAADYDLVTGLLQMTGGVTLSQGASTLSADRMTVNLTDGTARMEGGVRTVFQQEGGN